jgi:hypothetical protein
MFWHQHAILFIDYLPKRKTINAKYYSSLPLQLKDILNEKHRGKLTRMVLFLYENAAAHPAFAI